jgi:hypothetical protein
VGTLDQFFAPPLSVILNFAAGTVCILMGLGMFWLGRHIFSGARFLFSQKGETIRNLRRRKRALRRAVKTDAESRRSDTFKNQLE